MKYRVLRACREFDVSFDNNIIYSCFMSYKAGPILC